MALADFIPQIWNAMFLSKLRNNLVWGSVMNSNYEGDIASAGDTVKIPSSTTTVTVRDYTESTDIADPEEANGTTQDLLIDKQKYWHFYVDDIHEVQTRPDLMEDAMREASYQMANQMDDDFRATVVGGYNAQRNVSVSVGGDIANLADDDFDIAVLKAFSQIGLRMDEANLPREGRWSVVGPKLLKRLTDRFSIQGNSSGIFVPATSESTLRNGFAGTLLGFELRVTNKVDTVDIGSGQNAKEHDRYWFGQGTEANTRAMQIAETEAYRPERRFGDAVKGLAVYGSKQTLPARLFTLSMQTEA